MFLESNQQADNFLHIIRFAHNVQSVDVLKRITMHVVNNFYINDFETV